MPGGGISPDNSRWIPCRRYRKSFFLPGKVLSRRFRKRFLIHLRRSFQKGKLQFRGELESLAHPVAFEALCQKAGRMEWVIFAARQNLPGSIALKLPTPGTGFGSGANIIIHAVGVRGRIGFGDGDFIRAEGALQGKASSFREGWRRALL